MPDDSVGFGLGPPLALHRCSTAASSVKSKSEDGSVRSASDAPLWQGGAGSCPVPGAAPRSSAQQLELAADCRSTDSSHSGGSGGGR